MTTRYADGTARSHQTREERLERLRQLCAEAERRGLRVVAQAWDKQVNDFDPAHELEQVVEDHDPNQMTFEFDLDLGGEL